MNRRQFLLRTVPTTVLPMFFGSFTLKAYGHSPFLDTLIGSTVETDHVLVLVQLNGGNDGLNTVIPLDQYSALSAARTNILIPDSQVLRLADNAATGLHPAMPGLQALYNDQKLAIVQGVGYPNPSFSHFRATDIWLTGADSNQTLTTGWMGRYLESEFPDYPNGYPSTVMPDPLAIQIGTIVTPGLQGSSVSMGMAITSPTSFYQLVTGVEDPVPNTPAGHELAFIREVAQQTNLYASVIRAAAEKGTNKSTLYPASGNPLANQLKIVAQLVSGGLKTRIYVVNIGGFDTHADQVSATGGNSTGAHAKLLAELSAAISAFQDDLELLGVADRVIGMTFSEFGRRIKSNASLGTDHGTSAPMFLFGKNVSAGVFGTNPEIPTQASVNDNLAMQFDFRSVYASVLSDWFGVPPNQLNTVLLNNYNRIPVIGPYSGFSNGERVPTDFGLRQNYPNPFNPATTISYDLPRGMDVLLTVFDINGRNVVTLVDQFQPAGSYQATFDGSKVASGTYFCVLRSGRLVSRIKMLLLK